MKVDFQFVRNLDAQIKQEGVGGLKQLSQTERKTLQQALEHLYDDPNIEISDEIGQKIQHPSEYKASFWNSVAKFFQRHFSSDFVGSDALSEQIDHIVNPSIPTDMPPIPDEEVPLVNTIHKEEPEETIPEEPKTDSFMNIMAERRRKMIEDEDEEVPVQKEEKSFEPDPSPKKSEEIEKPIATPLPTDLMTQIQAGKKLKAIEKKPETEKPPVKDSLTNALSKQFDEKFKKEESSVESEDNLDIDDDEWR